MDSQQQIFADDTSLIPAIIQDEVTKKVLMLAYMNKEAYLKTISTKETWFFSRKRQQLWHKGATSGNRQIVKRIVYDCDADSLLIEVSPLGPACHTGKETCFHHTVYATEKTTTDIIEQLTETIKKRRNNPVDGSYTTYLFHEGLDKILKKVGEEASEVIIGAKNEDRSELLWEISDLTYHLLVLMELMGIKVSDIKNVLQKRHFGNKGAK